jgi:alkylated DNA nucleotide flippase Atl1
VKTWREKLERIREAKIVPVPARMQKRWGTGKMLIPRGVDVDSAVRDVPPGQLITVREIRARLAREHGADVTCPLVTGICLRIMAELAMEQERAGALRITPFWRVVRDDGELLEKMPGGRVEQARRLAEEGHRVTRSGVVRVSALSDSF